MNTKKTATHNLVTLAMLCAILLVMSFTPLGYLTIGPLAISLNMIPVAIGAIALKLNGHTDMTERDDECELGYWLGKPFWGRGYMPEAVRELLRHGFEELGMTTIWCAYYDGNVKSKRVQEKAGFVYHHTCEEVPVPLMNEIRIGHVNYMTKERWEKLNESN